MPFEQLARLKQRLTDSLDYDEVLQDFLCGLGIDPRFTTRGKAVADAFLTRIVEDTARRFVGLKEPIEPQLFTHIEDVHFFHGGFYFGGHVAVVMYFSDIALGALSLAPLHGQGKTHCVRFRATMEVPEPSPSPSRN